MLSGCFSSAPPAPPNLLPVDRPYAAAAEHGSPGGERARVCLGHGQFRPLPSVYRQRLDRYAPARSVEVPAGARAVEGADPDGCWGSTRLRSMCSSSRTARNAAADQPNNQRHRDSQIARHRIYGYTGPGSAIPVHEIFHAIAMNTWGVGPVWLNEGLAVLADGVWQGRPVHEVSRELLAQQKLVRFERLITDFRDEDPGSLYIRRSQPAQVHW